MKLLIADDEGIPLKALERTLLDWGHEVLTARDGPEAWAILQHEDAPTLAILDWMMPGLEGPEVCRRVRSLKRSVQPYLILLTSRDQKHEVVFGLNSGADDYVTKPFDRAELHSRMRVGERLLGLQQGLVDRVRELNEALAQVKQLQGLLPICAWCKDVRNDNNYWQSVEGYIAESSDLQFTHGICPKCLARESAVEVG